MFSSKNVSFSNVYAFLSKKIATFKKSYEIGMNKLFFQVRRNILLKKKNMCGRRTCWVKKGQTSAWWDKFLNNEVMDSDWLENFRVSKTSFEELVNILRPYLEKQVTRMRKPISTECQITFFSYYVSDEARYRKTANVFDISGGSVSLIIRKVSKTIVEFLGKDYMKLPEAVAEVENLTQKFLEHHGFPQCMGAIDGTHIPLCQPSQNYADDINRKGFTSINVQALSDYRYCFLDVVVKWPGSLHDSIIFLQSDLNQKLRNKFVPSCEKQIVEDEMKVPICILGDPAHPLLPFLMKEYPKV